MNYTIPVIPLRGMVILPGEIAHCDAGRKKTINAVHAAMGAGGTAFFCSQIDSELNDPTADGLHKVGTICQIKQIFRLQGEGIHMLVAGTSRAYAQKYISEDPYFEADVIEMSEIESKPAMILALRRRVQKSFAEYIKLTNKITNSQRTSLEEINDSGQYADSIVAVTMSETAGRQQILEETHVEQRLMKLAAFLNRELQTLRMDQEITHKLRDNIEKNQKEYFLREKMRVIRKELGENEEQEADLFRRRMQEKALPEAVSERLKREIDRLSLLPPGSHEWPMAHSYIECLLELPWLEQTKDNLNLTRARAVLEKNHYGMKKVKERIIETLAVQKLTGKPNGQILCLVGPPGVGKTSIISSIAQSMGRKFVRMSLGGVRDEAEIRGHRRTYIGAMPGRIIAAMRQAGANNPVLLFDEIDKLASDIHGDPASAMLEVLDSAQNFAFKDHYLELPYDLSHVMLFTTANDEHAIPRPLLDRMEIIHVQSYLAEEKLHIAKRHLLPKQLQRHGLQKTNLRITDEQILHIIQAYTRESGVRELERMLAAICRKAACQKAEGALRVSLSLPRIAEYLGQPKYRKDVARVKSEVGVVTGLAYTPTGGETISVEATEVPGTGALQLTGQLGEVMQESGRAAMTYVRAHANEWGLSAEEINKRDIHLHVPQGAVPKDGPSAGIAMAASILSALTGLPARADIAMTGEITLRGRVLPIGGVREKSLAALRAGITQVLLPEDNRKDIEELPEFAQKSITFTFIQTLKQALGIVLDGAEQAIESDFIYQVAEPPNMPVGIPPPGYSAEELPL